MDLDNDLAELQEKIDKLSQAIKKTVTLSERDNDRNVITRGDNGFS